MEKCIGCFLFEATKILENRCCQTGDGPASGPWVQGAGWLVECPSLNVGCEMLLLLFDETICLLTKHWKEEARCFEEWALDMWCS
jgi:hypothetical protein